MKTFKAFIKPFEAPQISMKKKKFKLIFALRPGSEQEGLSSGRASFLDAYLLATSKLQTSSFSSSLVEMLCKTYHLDNFI